MAIVATILSAGGTSEDARAADENGWTLAARAAGAKVPSEKTRAVVIQILAEHEASQRRYRELVPAKTCEWCGKPIDEFNEAHTSSWGKWHAHVRCENEMRQQEKEME